MRTLDYSNYIPSCYPRSGRLFRDGLLRKLPHKPSSAEEMFQEQRVGSGILTQATHQDHLGTLIKKPGPHSQRFYLNFSRVGDCIFEQFPKWFKLGECSQTLVYI